MRWWDVPWRRPAMAAPLLLVLMPMAAQAQLQVDITSGRPEPLPIAVPAFTGGDARSLQLGDSIAQVIAADLERSGLFKPIDPRAFLEGAGPLSVRPNFNNWRVINAQALLIGSTEIQADGRLRIEFRLWDVFAEQSMTGQSLSTVSDNWRRVAHIVADIVYKRITGEDGYFDTRIVYIAESGPAKQRVKRLAIMDQDSENNRFLTDGTTLVLTPRFSPTTQEITYLAYYNDQPRVYLFDIDTGAQEVLGDFPGMTFAPRFSPDGNKVVMSLAKDGNSEIYEMDLGTRREMRLTDNPAIDTAPSYSPDGRQITFESDRGGDQQIYVMNSDGSNPRRISFDEARYATPVWSPRGDLIAFTKIVGRRFFIGVMRPDGSGERLLSEGYLVEGPTWAPNGRVLMYFRQDRPDHRGDGGRPRLFSVDITGFNEREVITSGDASDPAWSPITK